MPVEISPISIDPSSAVKIPTTSVEVLNLAPMQISLQGDQTFQVIVNGEVALNFSIPTGKVFSGLLQIRGNLS